MLIRFIRCKDLAAVVTLCYEPVGPPSELFVPCTVLLLHHIATKVTNRRYDKGRRGEHVHQHGA